MLECLRKNLRGYLLDNLPGGIEGNHENLKGYRVFQPGVVKQRMKNIYCLYSSSTCWLFCLLLKDVGASTYPIMAEAGALIAES
jgi:hypothetical protein